MPVLVTAEVIGQTEEGYDGMNRMLSSALRQAPGLILHTAHPTSDGWRVLEVWQSKEQANQFFATFVHPHLPPGIRPRRTFQEVHGLIAPHLEMVPPTPQ